MSRRFMTVEHIRNFVIISHVDHGKSTLADRFLELTGTVEPRKMREQFLDRMDLEREKGITIKMQPVRMMWRPPSTNNESVTNKRMINNEYILNLIDTPGHADFSYEVSRALAAAEGAILLVDAAQGIQAQTLANLHLAQKQGLAIIPAINKIDLPSGRIEETKEEIMKLLDCQDSGIRLISAKTGQGVKELLEALIEKIPAPRGDEKKPLRALIFDSQFDAYKGVLAHVRVFDGTLQAGEKLKLLQTRAEFEALETGIFQPELAAKEKIGPGEIGYLASGLKEPRLIRAGDTITKFENRNSKFEILEEAEPLPGYREPRSMVWASIWPEDADDYERLADSIRKLKLNDASLVFEPQSSAALGRGFLMGFLGMLHLEITGERLKREYGLKLVISAPSVNYKLKLANGEERLIYSAAQFPENQKIMEIREPWARLNIISGEKYLGALMRLLEETRGLYISREYLGRGRLEIIYEAPLAGIIMDFHDRLKSATEGYGSMSYEILGYRPGNLVKLDILIAGERRQEFSHVVSRELAYEEGRRLTSRLKELLPRQLFPVAIQAAAGGGIIARQTLPAQKKDVAGYLYGGDRTRKMKLWKKQKRGKKRMLKTGRVEIPAEVFRQLLKK